MTARSSIAKLVSHLQAQVGWYRIFIPIVLTTGSIKEATGRANEDFREDLTLFILDYNKVAQTHLDLLTNLVAENGHPLPVDLNPDLLRHHFGELCEVAAVNIMFQPTNPTNMFKDMTAALMQGLGDMPSRERRAAAQLLHTLLGGRVPSDVTV